MLSSKLSKDMIIEMINNDLDLEMAIREKVEDIIKETLSVHPPMERVATEYVPVETNAPDFGVKIEEYKKKLDITFEEAEREFYYLKGKGISTEMNDINFAVLTEDVSKKKELAELLLEIFK